MCKKSSESLEKALRAVEKLLKQLSRLIEIDEVYLFGSYARGDWVKTSDVDLVIVSRDFREMKYLERLDLIYRLEWEERITPFIEVVPLTPEELRDRLRSSASLRDAARYWRKIYP